MQRFAGQPATSRQITSGFGTIFGTLNVDVLLAPRLPAVFRGSIRLIHDDTRKSCQNPTLFDEAFRTEPKTNGTTRASLIEQPGHESFSKVFLPNHLRIVFITVKLPMQLTESCPSGRRSTIGNRVGVTSVSGVQIPDSPPASSHGAYPLRFAPCFTPRRSGRVVECGGLENRLRGIPAYEGSNPSSSAIICLTCGPQTARFFIIRAWIRTRKGAELENA